MSTNAFSPSVSRRFFLFSVAATLLACSKKVVDYREVSWEELIPEDWDPLAIYKDMPRIASDSDPRAAGLYQRLREDWDKAPTISGLSGKAVKLSGYLVPLSGDKDGIREFLLVPYFGACIHTPPPPANQIVHVHSAEAIKGVQTSAVTVSGTLNVERASSTMGVSGYTMTADRVEPYRMK